jgi:hypothetical protein
MIVAVAGGKATIKGKHVERSGSTPSLELKEIEIDRLSEPCTPGNCKKQPRPPGELSNNQAGGRGSLIFIATIRKKTVIC